MLASKKGAILLTRASSSEKFLVAMLLSCLLISSAVKLLWTITWKPNLENSESRAPVELRKKNVKSFDLLGHDPSFYPSSPL